MTQDQINQMTLEQKVDLAQNPNTSPEDLSLLAKDYYCIVIETVAQNPNTTPEDLSILKDGDSDVRHAVAQNPNTKPEDLSVLSKDYCWQVRKAVAENPNTSKKTLDKLSKDENFDVKYADERLNKIRVEESEELEKTDTKMESIKDLQNQIDKLNNTVDKLIEYFEKKENSSQLDKNTNNSLRSSAEESGEIVHQIVGFTNREKKTIRNVITSTIEQSQFTKFKTLNDRTINIHDQHVNWFETIPVKKKK